MAYHYATQVANEHTARAVGKELNISSKIAVEVCSYLRNRRLQDAKRRLGNVLAKQEAIPVKRYNFDLAHKKGGVGPGRYPIKTCKAILGILESAEANAQFKGLNTSLLQIIHICSHNAGKSIHYGRRSGREMKKTHVEVVVEEKGEKEEIKK